MKVRPRFTFPESIKTVGHFIRHYFKEITVALVPAIVTAAAIDAYRRGVERDRMLANLRAVATLEAFDNKDRAIERGSGVFITSGGSGY